MDNTLQNHFPKFTDKLASSLGAKLENKLPALPDEEIAKLEETLGIPLPKSYKTFLSCTRGFWVLNGTVQIGTQHPFLHEFPTLEELTPPQRKVVTAKGGSWPPPSQGMLCFAEFFMEADGDQVLFDVSNGLINGEYPVMYYSHESQPPSVRKLADSFEQWLNEFLTYEEFTEE